MAYNPILSSEIVSGAPIDTALLTKIKNNQDHFKNNTGSAQLQFSNNIANGASAVNEFGNDVFIFDPSLQQIIKAVVKVPTGYTGGFKPLLNLVMYTADANAASTIKFFAKVSLFKSANTSLNNTSFIQIFNSVITNVGVAERHQQMVIDLSDATGNVNAEPILVDSLIQIELYRAPDDTVNVPVSIIPSLSNINFA